jgi:alkanesulfonate monooxygenase SsuD/methylene tetrahydromethanopterin reductase-like flavin-dependent oxidoreductase (luciferase family)
MRAYHFTEMPYPYVPVEVEQSLKSARVIVPNSYCDPNVMAELYNRYLDEYEYADHLGLDIMLNEHHQTLTCLSAVVPITAAALARRSKRARITILGTPLPHRDNPVRVAEEIAMLDCISYGRIISGFVRGVPTEIQPANTNPVLTRQRFEEAHDLILKAWTTPEPFNWEGRFWHFRYVNVWPRPYQQPHPPIWVTGSSPESVPWVADHGYTFACFLTPYEVTERLVNTYRDRCTERELPQPGPDKFAYLALCYTAETDEAAQDYGKELLWYLYRERHPYLNAPPGYVPPPAMAKSYLGVGGKPYRDSFESLQTKGIVMVGNPDTMIEKIKYLHERCGIGHLLMMNQAGLMSTGKVRRSMELFATEVYPAIRDLGEPVSAHPARAPVMAARSAAAEVGKPFYGIPGDQP